MLSQLLAESSLRRLTGLHGPIAFEHVERISLLMRLY